MRRSRTPSGSPPRGEGQGEELYENQQYDFEDEEKQQREGSWTSEQERQQQKQQEEDPFAAAAASASASGKGEKQNSNSTNNNNSNNDRDPPGGRGWQNDNNNKDDDKHDTQARREKLFPKSAQPNDGRVLYCIRVVPQISKKDIIEALSPYGKVDHVVLARSHNTAYVVFETVEGCEKALAEVPHSDSSDHRGGKNDCIAIQCGSTEHSYTVYGQKSKVFPNDLAVPPSKIMLLSLYNCFSATRPNVHHHSQVRPMLEVVLKRKDCGDLQLGAIELLRTPKSYGPQNNRCQVNVEFESNEAARRAIAALDDQLCKVVNPPRVNLCVRLAADYNAILDEFQGSRSQINVNDLANDPVKTREGDSDVNLIPAVGGGGGGFGGRGRGGGGYHDDGYSGRGGGGGRGFDARGRGGGRGGFERDLPPNEFRDREKICYNCKQPGHPAFHCPNQRCFKCGENGHRAMNCPGVRQFGPETGRGGGGGGNSAAAAAGWDRGGGAGGQQQQQQQHQQHHQQHQDRYEDSHRGHNSNNYPSAGGAGGSGPGAMMRERESPSRVLYVSLIFVDGRFPADRIESSDVLNVFTTAKEFITKIRFVSSQENRNPVSNMLVEFEDVRVSSQVLAKYRDYTARVKSGREVRIELHYSKSKDLD